MNAKQLIRKLKRHGVQILSARGKGGHRLAEYNDKLSTIPVHGDTDLGPQFIKMLCKQLGIDPKDIL